MGNDLFYFSFELWGGIFFLLAALILWIPGRSGGVRKEVVWPVLVTGIMLIADYLAFRFRGGDSELSRVMVYAGNLISILSGFWIAGLFFHYLYGFLPEKGRNRFMEWGKPAILIISGFDTVLLIISQFNGILYTIDEGNVYHRGSLMGLAMGLQLILLLSFFILAIYSRTKVVILVTAGSLAALAVQTLIYGYPLTNIISGIAAIVLFVREMILQTEKTESKEIMISEKEDTIREMQTRIALSQIKPHFLYNALNSIYVLCGRDVNEARRAISNLSDYLRSNMSSIDSKLPIPFSREMELVESYLAIEKIRFPEELNYTIVTPVTAFSLPALTIQPLVENAVRHGIMPLDAGGIVTITTRETDQAYIVSISDNGIGFDPGRPVQEGDTKEHIGIKNVRERLKRLSGGELEIRSEPGHGTEAIIRIPKH